MHKRVLFLCLWTLVGSAYVPDTGELVHPHIHVPVNEKIPLNTGELVHPHIHVPVNEQIPSNTEELVHPHIHVPVNEEIPLNTGELVHVPENEENLLDTASDDKQSRLKIVSNTNDLYQSEMIHKTETGPVHREVPPKDFVLMETKLRPYNRVILGLIQLSRRSQPRLHHKGANKSARQELETALESADRFKTKQNILPLEPKAYTKNGEARLNEYIGRKWQEHHRDSLPERHRDSLQERHRDSRQERHRDSRQERHRDSLQERHRDSPGLSYARFEYRGMNVSYQNVSKSNITVTFTLANVGDAPGNEVVQCYISWGNKSLPVPQEQLVYFDSINLDVNQDIDYAFTLTWMSWAYWNNGTWAVQTGNMTLCCGDGQPQPVPAANIEHLQPVKAANIEHLQPVPATNIEHLQPVKAANILCSQFLVYA